MKKLFIVSILTALSLTGCLKSDNDIFNQSASGRIDAAVDQALKVLQGAQNGWRMEIYPDPDMIYGGYTVFVKFDEKEVTAMSEIFGSETTDTSYYSVTAESGPMLSFDTYNDIIHFFADAAYGASIGKKQFGLYGDSDFIVMSANPSFVELKGRKTGNHAFLYPVESGVNWGTEVDAYVDIAERIESLNFKSCTVNGAEAGLYFPGTINNFSQRAFEITEANGNETEVFYVNTKTGIKFYEPVTIGGKTIDHMNFIDDWYLQSEDGSVQILATEPIRSSNTFAISAENVTYKSATAVVNPSNTDGYYFDVYAKSAIEGFKDRDIIRSLLADMNSYIGAYTPDYVYNAFASVGPDAYTVDALKAETEYVVVAFGISLSRDGSEIVSTTGMTKYTFTTAPMPELEANYAKWLGTWSATSKDSYVTHKAQTITGITIGIGIPNETYELKGFSILALRDTYSVEAKYVASNGTLTIANNQEVGVNSSGYVITYRGHIISPSTGSQSILNGTYTGMTWSTPDGKTGTTTCYKSASYTVNGMDFFAINGTSYAHFTSMAPGFESKDYLIGPEFALTKTADYVFAQAEPTPQFVQTRGAIQEANQQQGLQQNRPQGLRASKLDQTTFSWEVNDWLSVDEIFAPAETIE